GPGCRLVRLPLAQHATRSAGCRSGFRIGPAVARSDETHFREAKVQHRPGRLADILAQLRADEDDDRWLAAHRSLLWPGGGTASFSTRSAISAKSPGSLKSL